MKGRSTTCQVQHLPYPKFSRAKALLRESRPSTVLARRVATTDLSPIDADQDGAILRVALIRHGQTEYNRLGLYTGWRDIPLTLVGVLQAIAAGAALGQDFFHPLPRGP